MVNNNIAPILLLIIIIGGGKQGIMGAIAKTVHEVNPLKIKNFLLTLN
jgi:predicted Rossmann-fold nucleotide-binding protein